MGLGSLASDPLGGFLVAIQRQSPKERGQGCQVWAWSQDWWPRLGFLDKLLVQIQGWSRRSGHRGQI